MKIIFMAIIVSLTLFGCATNNSNSVKIKPEDNSKKINKATENTPKAKSIVVDTADIQLLEKMNRAMGDYVLKNDRAAFENLCKDTRFDCFVEERLFPKKKKKIKRSVPPYASGSKMGLQEEERLNVKYNFYP